MDGHQDTCPERTKVRKVFESKAQKEWTEEQSQTVRSAKRLKQCWRDENSIVSNTLRGKILTSKF